MYNPPEGDRLGHSLFTSGSHRVRHAVFEDTKGESMGQLLTMRGVWRRFGEPPNTVTALAGVDFDVEQGEMVAIMGPSGSGKSTLLGIAGGLEQPSEGSVVLGGRGSPPAPVVGIEEARLQLGDVDLDRAVAAAGRARQALVQVGRQLVLERPPILLAGLIPVAALAPRPQEPR